MFDGTIGSDFDWLSASLTGEAISIGVTVIEDIVLVTNGKDGTMGVAGEVARGLWIFVVSKSDIAD